ncbi:MAG: hypothetical protein E4H00_09130 [Myxococcales bacterium]|nr:MAG: hypothetical protein E4H00_09130 [Myxococcales bacterium]
MKRCYDEITTVMQATLDDLAAEHPYPVLERLVELQPSRLLRKLMSRNARPRTAREVGSTPPRRGRQPPAKRRPRHAATKKRTPRD